MLFLVVSVPLDLVKNKFVTRSFGIFLMLFFFWSLLVWLFFAQLIIHRTSDGSSDNRYFSITMTLTFENRNNNGNIWYFTRNEKEIGLFMNNSWQTVYLINVSYPISSFETDDDGNPVAYVEFPKSGLMRGENFSYQVNYRVVLKPRDLPRISENFSGSLSDIPEDLKTKFCSLTGVWQSDSSLICKYAFEILGNETNVLSAVSDFIMWIVRNIKYESLDVPRYPNETLLEKKGDCDDQANLLIGFCRAVGIPAYLQIGCIYKQGIESTSNFWNGLWTSTLTNIGWHGWAVVYVPPWGWLPVDLTYFTGNTSNPLSHITSSAIVAFPTVQYINVTVSDYVLESRLQKATVISEAHRIISHDIMVEEFREKVTFQNSVDAPQFTFISIEILVVTLVFLAIFSFLSPLSVR